MDHIKVALSHLNEERSLFLQADRANRFDYVVNKRLNDLLYETYNKYSCAYRYSTVNTFRFLETVINSLKINDYYSVNDTSFVIIELEKLKNITDKYQYDGLVYILLKIETETDLVFPEKLQKEDEAQIISTNATKLVIKRSFITYTKPLQNLSYAYSGDETDITSNRYDALTETQNNAAVDALSLININDNERIEPIVYIEVLIAKFDITIYKGTMLRLLPNAWINDDIVDFYMKLLQQYADKIAKTNYYFSSMFMGKLLEDGKYDFDKVKKWKDQQKIKSFDWYNKIFFPINISNSHWVLICADRSKLTLTYYDSLGNDGDLYLDCIEKYFKEYSRNDKWTRVNIPNDQPIQMNGCDCGIFALMTADFLTSDLSINYIKQDGIDFLRRKICSSILAGELPYSD